MKIYEVKVNDSSKLEVVSLVDKPANQTEVMKLKEDSKLELSLDEDKMILSGVVLIPGQEIYRRDKDNNEYYLTFNEQTITDLSNIYMKSANQINTTLDHLKDAELSDVQLIENWIVLDSEIDKAKALGFEVPNGTWMQSMKINSVELWGKIKEGKYNGFSIELRGFDVVELSEEEQKLKEIIRILS